MSENENQQSTIAANLCKNGCGFYGSTQFDGMCSVCHKENMKKRQKQDEEQIQKPTSSPHAASLLCASSNNVFESSSNNKRLSNSNDQPIEHTSEEESHGLQQSALIAGSAASAESTNTNEECHDGPSASSIGVSLKSAAAGTSSPAAGLSAELASISSSGVSAASASSNGTTDSCSQSKKSNRCAMCKKKVGLTGFNCRCGGLFCSTHRYSDKHDCQFDYQSHGQAEIRKANPQVVSAKIDKL